MITRNFTKNFDYGSAEHHDYPDGPVLNVGTFPWSSVSYHEVLDDLKANKPVILGGYTDQNSALGLKWPAGLGHKWVCDGAIDNGCNASQLLFYMNWGWSGNNNGSINSDTLPLRVDGPRVSNGAAVSCRQF